jgi:hypothetical protein
MSNKELASIRNNLGNIINYSREFDATSPMNIRNLSIEKTISNNTDYLCINHNGIFVSTTDRIVDIMLLPSSKQYKKLTVVLFQAKKERQCGDFRTGCYTDIHQNNIRYAIFDSVRLDSTGVVQSWENINCGEKGELIYENKNTVCHFIINKSFQNLRVADLNQLEKFYLENRDFIQQFVTPFLILPRKKK